MVVNTNAGDTAEHVLHTCLQVDCDVEKSLCSRMGVSGFPTLKWFPKGSTEGDDFQTPRTADALVAEVNHRAGVNGKIKKVSVGRACAALLRTMRTRHMLDGVTHWSRCECAVQK